MRLFVAAMLGGVVGSWCGRGMGKSVVMGVVLQRGICIFLPSDRTVRVSWFLLDFL